MSSYLELLDLTREPFSNSPDPDAYYRTPTHEHCLNRLEIAIRLRRGLNVVLGEVGTGKSTLCRCLLRNLSERDGIDVFLLLDAGCENAEDFVRNLYELFSGERAEANLSRREGIGLIQSRVFDKALEENRNLVLFVDEGQKLSPAALEVLRELLNFETNTEKLLQIVIFGQPELALTIEGMPNFKDRINESLYLRPLSMRESIRLIRHRLRLAGGQKAERLFSLGSLMALHSASHGKPRQLMRLGHQMLLALLVGNRRSVTRGMVRAQVARNNEGNGFRRGRWLIVGLALACLAGAYQWMPDVIKTDARTHLEATLSSVRGWLPKAGTPTSKAPESSVAQQPETSVSTEAVRQEAVRQEAAQQKAVQAVPQPPQQTPSRSENPVGKTPPTAVSTERPSEEASATRPSETPEGALPPESLGVFRLQPGASLVEVARAVYGSGSALRLVESRNPGYRTGSTVEQTLELPAVLYTPPSAMLRGKLLSLGEFDTPEAAYAAWRSYGKRALSVELAPIWRPGVGLRFHILAPRSFATERNAWSWLSRFSPPTGATVRLLPPLDDACLVFHKFTVK